MVHDHGLSTSQSVSSRYNYFTVSIIPSKKPSRTKSLLKIRYKNQTNPSTSHHGPYPLPCFRPVLVHRGDMVCNVAAVEPGAVVAMVTSSSLSLLLMAFCLGFCCCCSVAMLLPLVQNPMVHGCPMGENDHPPSNSSRGSYPEKIGRKNCPFLTGNESSNKIPHSQRRTATVVSGRIGPS